MRKVCERHVAVEMDGEYLAFVVLLAEGGCSVRVMI